jgi:ATP-binding cassette subfamily A (ABC1) protein 1
MTTSVLDQLADDEPDLGQISDILKPIFTCLFPYYCLGKGFLSMSLLYNTAQAKLAFGIQSTYNPFEFDNVGRNLLALSIQGIAFFSLNMLIQYKFFIRFKPVQDITKLKLPSPSLLENGNRDAEEEDDDVKSERTRILNNEQILKKEKNKQKKGIIKKLKFSDLANFKNDLKSSTFDEDPQGDKSNKDYVKLVNLTKIYKKFKNYKIRKHVAVNSLCLGINKGECFGLIGVNGAGKTTTFKMITGDISASGGDVILNNYSVSKQIEKVHRNLGYCPQFDALMPLLTAREHLLFFARLRGIPEKYVHQVSQWAMNKVGLDVFADRIAGDFSGGNKRKLSTAIALVGDPSVICLDEPTSGMVFFFFIIKEKY